MTKIKPISDNSTLKINRLFPNPLHKQPRILPIKISLWSITNEYCHYNNHFIIPQTTYDIICVSFYYRKQYIRRNQPNNNSTVYDKKYRICVGLRYAYLGFGNYGNHLVNKEDSRGVSLRNLICSSIVNLVWPLYTNTNLESIMALFT